MDRKNSILMRTCPQKIYKGRHVTNWTKKLANKHWWQFQESCAQCQHSVLAFYFQPIFRLRESTPGCELFFNICYKNGVRFFFVCCCVACERNYCLHWLNGGQSVATAHLPTPALPRRWSTLASGFFVSPVGFSKMGARWDLPIQGGGTQKYEVQIHFPLCWTHRIRHRPGGGRGYGT